MKKIKYLLVSLLTLFLLPIAVNAASGKIAVSGPSQAVVGNTITVTVNLTSSTGIGSWEMDLDYNKSYLQLTSSTAESKGTAMVGYASADAGTKSVKYTFKFKVLKTGSTAVTVPSYDVYAADMSSMSITPSGRNIKIITQQELEASYSKNNDLSSLSVDGFELTPAFAKDVLDYNVIVPEDTKEINIVAKASDSKSSITGAGTHEVTSGSNSFPVVVKAENGSEKTYNVNVEVKDANPINVEVNGKNYTVVKIREYLPKKDAFSDHTITINNMEIPAYQNENLHVVLVGLKDEAGNISLFRYENEKYTIYQELGLNRITIMPMETDKTVTNYTIEERNINGVNTKVYSLNKDSRFVLIYGMNIETGEEGFYEYDTETDTLILYNDDYIKTLEEKINLYTYIIIGFLAIIVVMFILGIVLLRKKKKSKPKNTEEVKDKMKKKKKKKDEFDF